MEGTASVSRKALIPARRAKKLSKRLSKVPEAGPMGQMVVIYILRLITEHLARKELQEVVTSWYIGINYMRKCIQPTM